MVMEAQPVTEEMQRLQNLRVADKFNKLSDPWPTEKAAAEAVHEQKREPEYPIFCQTDSQFIEEVAKLKSQEQCAEPAPIHAAADLGNILRAALCVTLLPYKSVQYGYLFCIEMTANLFLNNNVAPRCKCKPEEQL
ncbi:hypothetical protein B0H13DRAFT_1882258 [Mycena leptocephala]|nr:hypothetical protein B0H13DRAFT_1882258 [Mycena leptocephala]